jgi:methanogenic corrinoid protein MtbC1
VATMLRVYGFEVHDLGRDVPIPAFIEKAKEVNANIVGSSALMTTTQVGQKTLEKALKDAGLRDKVKTMVGGAVATEHWAAKIGADLYAETAGEAVTKLKEMLSGKGVKK